MNEMSDLEFLRKMNFNSKVLREVDNSRPIFCAGISNIGLQVPECFCHSYTDSNKFTHTPDEEIMDTIDSILSDTRHDLYTEIDVTENAEYFSSEEKIPKISKLRDTLAIFKSLPPFILPPNFSNLRFRNSENDEDLLYDIIINKLPISRLRELYEHIGEFEHPKTYSEFTLDNGLSYKSYVRQLINRVCDRLLEDSAEINLPTINQMHAERQNIETMLERYSKVPENSLLIQPFNDECYFSRKRASLYSRKFNLTCFNPIIYTQELGGIVAYMSGDRDYGFWCRTQKKDLFPLGINFVWVPKEKEKETIEKVLSNLYKNFKDISQEAIPCELNEIYEKLEIS